MLGHGSMVGSGRLGCGGLVGGCLVRSGDGKESLLRGGLFTGSGGSFLAGGGLGCRVSGGGSFLVGGGLGCRVRSGAGGGSGCG